MNFFVLSLFFAGAFAADVSKAAASSPWSYMPFLLLLLVVSIFLSTAFRHRPLAVLGVFLIAYASNPVHVAKPALKGTEVRYNDFGIGTVGTSWPPVCAKLGVLGTQCTVDTIVVGAFNRFHVLKPATFQNSAVGFTNRAAAWFSANIVKPVAKFVKPPKKTVKNAPKTKNSKKDL